MNTDNYTTFHICVKGLDGTLLYMDNEDYRISTNYIAIAQYNSGIKVLAYCQMPNHLHFVVTARSSDEAKKFSETYKRSYSMYYHKKNNESHIFKRQNDLIKEINDICYLRQCIAYVLRNPLAAGLLKSTETYRWSSQSCYFRDKDSAIKECYPISGFSKRYVKGHLKTCLDLSKCNFCLDKNKSMIEPASFVNYKAVEMIYNNSATLFMRYMGWIDDKKIDYELVIQQKIRYDDLEMRKIAETICTEVFQKSYTEILPEQKRKLASIIFKKYRTSSKQLARVLRVRKEILE